MRPLKLIISGFGTYCKPTEIDLSKLGTNGLFLITGDTGSGKTTIFDAITYALYGDLNGQNRNVAMIRSTFATPDIPTEVDFTFEYKGKIYNIKRNPEYQRASKRGEGLTTQIAEATLTMPDGSVITQNSKVTAAVVELLRINKEQFSQIVMIAQGDFQKLLMEGTERRMEIFRNLFKTDYYLKLQSKLLDEEKLLAGDCKSIRKEIQVHLDSIQCDEENILKLKLEKVQKNEVPMAEGIEIINSIIHEDVDQQTKLQNELKIIDENLLKNAEILGIAKKIRTAEEDLKIKKENIKSEQSLNIKIREEFENQKKKQPEREAKEKELTILNNEFSDYDDFENVNKRFLDTETNIISKKGLCNKNESILENLEFEINKLEEELKGLTDENVKLVGLKVEQEKLEEKSNGIIQIDKELLSYEKNLQKYEEAIQDYKHESQRAEELDIEYKKMRKAFLDEQAGIIAETLEENQPCPVCGSIHHPEPAKKSSKAPGEAELNAAEKEASIAQKLVEEKNHICIELKADLGSRKLNIENQWEKLFQKQIDEIIVINLKEKISEEMTSLDQLKSKNQEALMLVEKKISRKEKIEQILPELEKEILEKKENITKLTAEIAGLKSTLDSLGEQRNKLREKLRFESKNEAVTAAKKIGNEINDLKKAFENSQNKLIASDNKIAAYEGEIKQLEEQLKDAENIDIDSAVENDLKLKNDKEICTSKIQYITSRIDRNTDAVGKLNKNQDKLSEMENRYTWVSALSRTANGNLSSGKEKIKLETYIQMNYFDRIIAHANKRLMIMSDGQYELIRKKEADNLRSQTGLELDVIDHYNGGQRSVKSLSGGESFEASLALALGLSDEVRMSAGGIQLDSMFVDEGFGTLDSETLQKAFKALSSITDGNRIVGIISHVDLLKEKIDRQIIVKKERTGGSTVQINV